MNIDREKFEVRHIGPNKNDLSQMLKIVDEKSIDDLLRVIEGFLKEGYKRIKIKIKPGWDDKLIFI